jgi:hypothetical protein
MAEDEDRSEEGLSTTTKIVAGTAIGVAVPAAVAAGRKLIGSGNGDDGGEEERPQNSRSDTGSRGQQTSARTGSAKRGSSSRTSPSRTSASRSSSGKSRSGSTRSTTSRSSTTTRAASTGKRAARAGSTAKTRAGSSSSKTPTREQLYKQATRLKVEGRSRMTKAQLERAVARAKK